MIVRPEMKNQPYYIYHRDALITKITNARSLGGGCWEIHFPEFVILNSLGGGPAAGNSQVRSWGRSARIVIRQIRMSGAVAGEMHSPFGWKPL